MSNVYILGIERGQQTQFVQVFHSEQELFDYVKANVKVSVLHHGGYLVYEPKYKVSVFTSEEAQTSSYKPQAGVPTFVAADEPYFSLTVPSQSDSEVTYGVAYDGNGTPLACTCPDFEKRRAAVGDWCKHMDLIDTQSILRWGYPYWFANQQPHGTAVWGR